MGVYIKGMNIPEMADNTGIKMELRKLDGVVTIGIMTGGYSCAEQWNYYPIAKIQEPHGRLIDADVIDGRVSIREDGFKGETHDVLTQVRGLIATTPTVIDAEGEK